MSVTSVYRPSEPRLDRRRSRRPTGAAPAGVRRAAARRLWTCAARRPGGVPSGMHRGV